MSVKPIRCAIYTRKSSEEGLEQAFNSLDAQRDACGAYVMSQAGEGWTLAPGIYDDGGFSGGTLDRPALKRLMAEIEAKRIDVIVVYKVDRLTRSLADFARIVEVLDRQGASFVSVTQAFNTTSSMGRLTLNVLLSFAQFEREVTGERIRDKIAASKKLGMWMGGRPPLGYRPQDRTLVIEPDEAEQVRHIFRRYLELGSVHKLRHDLAAAGLVSKRCVSQAGKRSGGRPMARGALFHLLRNRLYLGEIPHKTASYPGQHQPIIDADLFEAVQAKLDETAIVLRPNRPTPDAKAHAGAPLKGLIFDAAGHRMSPVSARRRAGATYRYYISQPLQAGGIADRRILQRTPAGLIEDLVHDRIRRIGIAGDDHKGIDWTAIRTSLTRVEISAAGVSVQLKFGAHPRPGDAAGLAARLGPDDQLEVTEAGIKIMVPARFTRRSGTLVALNSAGGDALLRVRHDAALSTSLLRSEAWKRRLLLGKAATIEDLARQEGVTASYVTRVLRVAFLAPDLKRAILDGAQPGGLTLQRVLTQDMPLDWRRQRELYRR
jgi:DNA invertase Pin-like site-specific DNA recombinase